MSITWKHPWRRHIHCRDAGDASSGAACTVTVPAVGQASVDLVQPGERGEDAAPPEPCTLTAQPRFSPPLLARCVLGAALVLGSHHAAASRPGQAALRLYCAVAPVVAGFQCILLLAFSALFFAAALALFSRQLEGVGLEGTGLGEAR